MKSILNALGLVGEPINHLQKVLKLDGAGLIISWAVDELIIRE